jgi:hypothetical protein
MALVWVAALIGFLALALAVVTVVAHVLGVVLFVCVRALKDLLSLSLTC